MNKDLQEFTQNFNIVENALDMRTLMRWNGRDLRNRENLAEHTHLVVACAIEIYDFIQHDTYLCIDFERVIRRCMLHDALELLRGDILSITKDVVPGLRDFTDCEEHEFMDQHSCKLTEIEESVVELADLKACYKYVERELKYPSNDFATYIYTVTKKKYDDKFEKFCEKYNLSYKTKEVEISNRLKKGYLADAGTDILLNEDITILPMSTVSINLNINITPKEGEMAVLCARTSAAAKGICVAMCPIDANYTGDVTAIVHNVSNEIITYKKGESFCQVVFLPIIQITDNVEVKKPGKRSDGKLGSTGI